MQEEQAMNEKMSSLFKKAEIILYAGPFFIGWIPGIWRYEFSENEFKVAISGMIMLVLYSIILMLNHTIAFLDIAGYSQYPLYIDSVFALLYIGATILNTYNQLKGNRKFCPLHGRVMRSIEKTVKAF